MKSSLEPNIALRLGVTGTIFNIQRYSIHDGPGIRTVIFVKGCPLHCVWCDNPEGQKRRPELVFFSDRCFACGMCVEACPRSALLEGKGTIDILREKCDLCGACVPICYSGALQQIGKTMTVNEAIREVEKDRVFYEANDGGMTVSGGEPTTQPTFVEALLSVARERGFHTALETCGDVQWPVLKRLLRFTDLVLYDIKAMNESLHERWVGSSNVQILSNAVNVARTKPMIIRIPVVPGVNDGEENIRAVATFAAKLRRVKEIHLLPYHKLGAAKYARLNLKYQIGTLESPSDALMRELKEIVTESGFKTKIGG